MSADLSSPDAPPAVLDGAGLKIAVVCARFNSAITMRLLKGVRRGLAAAKVQATDVVEEWVPGAYELPLAAQAFAESGGIDAVICIGCVIRGETTHYEAVAGECAAGIQQAQLATGVPIVFGVLTTETPGQALARSEGPGGHNVGEDGAAVAVEMARLLDRIRKHS